MGLVLEALRCASAAKSINSRALNLAGAQVSRTVVARTAQHVRRSPVAKSEDARSVSSNGFVVIPDFLSVEHFTRVREESERLVQNDDAVRVEHVHGRNVVSQFDLLTTTPADCPGLHEFMVDQRLLNLVEAVEKRTIDPLSGHRVLEVLTQGAGDEPDQEASLHVDTFFHNHKAWLYLDDVTIDHGPLVYVGRSHRLSARRLWFAYRESIGDNNGSRRIPASELEEFGLTEKVITCPRNTLVVANTAGYHRRIVGKTGLQRRAIQFSYRFNPFFPAGLNADYWLTSRNPLLRKHRP